ncbi:hypothetical protein F4604DRAFT_1674518 [Suillus subluteus]|nr:hypothetical protein F4604DRAFT_1674518 [Suillus subluteus]
MVSKWTNEDEPANIYVDNPILDCDMPAAHKLSGWTATDDDHLLRQSFYSRNANPIWQKAIHDDHGVCWSILNLIAGYALHISCYAYGDLQGVMAHLFIVNITTFRQLGENQSLKKADKWRRLLIITPVLLWWSWKDENDDMPDSDVTAQLTTFVKNGHCQKPGGI